MVTRIRARALEFLPGVVLAVGAVLRFAQYLHNRSLWLDEVSLAMNIVKRGFVGLFEPLRNAVAPPLFAVIVKAFILVLGPTELALRLLPLLASLAGLGLFWKLAKETLPRGFAVLALAFMAFSSRHVFYAQELKQYSADVAVTLLLVLAMTGPARPGFSWRACIGWGLLGAAAPWLSFSSVFVMGGLGLALFWSWLRRPDRRVLAGLAVTAFFWLASLAAFYAVVIRRLPRLGNLQAYWGDAFLPWPDGLESLAVLRDTFYDAVLYFGFTGFALHFLVLLAALGVVSLWQGRPPLARAAILTVLLAYLASALRSYPLSGRLALYLSPYLYLAVAAGAERLCRGRRGLLTLAVIGLLAGPFLAVNAPLALEPIRREELKPLLAILEKRLEPDDCIAVYYKARRAFDFYWGRYKLGPPERVLPGTDREEPFYLPPGRVSGRRVWLVISHVPEEEEHRIHRGLPAGAERLESHWEYGASLHLYRFPETPAP